jgi:hypothetical protein
MRIIQRKIPAHTSIIVIMVIRVIRDVWGYLRYQHVLPQSAGGEDSSRRCEQIELTWNMRARDVDSNATRREQ